MQEESKQPPTKEEKESLREIRSFQQCKIEIEEQFKDVPDHDRIIANVAALRDLNARQLRLENRMDLLMKILEEVRKDIKKINKKLNK